MSVSASINVHLPKNGIIHKPAIEIIQVLISSGWTLSHNGYIGYLPLGDKDSFDWQEKEINIETLTDILKAKEDANEIVGVIMTWQNTEIGGTFLFWTNEKYETFTMGISIDRQTMALDDDYKITNFQWYLSKLLPPLNKVWTVEYFSFEQHI
jgi:hypothetical protein